MTTWTETLLADCKRLYIDEGRSASETARILGHGATRNAVVGQAHRRGWLKAHRMAPAAPKTKDAPIPRSREMPAAPVAEKEFPPLPERQAEGHEPKVHTLQGSNYNSAPLIGRRFGQCAWPVGIPARPAEQLCCAKSVPDGTRMPYCRDHRSLAIGKVVSAQELTRSLRRYA